MRVQSGRSGGTTATDRAGKRLRLARSTARRDRLHWDGPADWFPAFLLAQVSGRRIQTAGRRRCVADRQWQVTPLHHPPELVLRVPSENGGRLRDLGAHLGAYFENEKRKIQYPCGFPRGIFTILRFVMYFESEIL